MPTATELDTTIEATNRLDFTYFDSTHVYMLDGQRCRSITNVAKIPTDDYTVNQWRHRMAAFGFLADPTLLEDIAAHRDDKKRIEDIIQKAIDLAGANRGAQRGTQAHAATEYGDLDQPLLTDQQRRDASVWRRTLEAYGIEVIDDLIERCVLYPDDLICGRFDRYVRIGDSAALVDLDIKTGTSAVRYPHGTAVQLALHVNAPLIQTDRVHRTTDDGSTYETTSAWATQPAALRTDVAYVLSMPTRDDAEMGTLYEFTLDGKYAGTVAARAAIFARHFQLNKGLCRSIPAPRQIGQASAAEVGNTGKMLPTDVPADNVVDFDAAKAKGELRARITMLGDAPKALLRMAWDVPTLGRLDGDMTLEQITAANELVDQFDGFAQVADPVTESRNRHPSNGPSLPHWQVDEGDDPPPPDIVDRLNKVYTELPDSARSIVDEWALQATRHRVTFHGSQMTRRRFHLLTGAMHAAANDVDDDIMRRIIATVADDDWPHIEALPVGAAIGLMHVEQSEEFAEFVLRFLGGEYHLGDNGRLTPNTNS